MVSRAGFASLLGASFLLLLRSAEPLGFNHRPTTAGDELSAAPSRYLTREERWMSQRLDHFSPTVSSLLHPWNYARYVNSSLRASA